MWLSMVLVVCVRISSRLNLVVLRLIGWLCYVMVWLGGEMVSLLKMSVLLCGVIGLEVDMIGVEWCSSVWAWVMSRCGLMGLSM